MRTERHPEDYVVIGTRTCVKHYWLKLKEKKQLSYNHLDDAESSLLCLCRIRCFQN